jgi:hypothetical protein
MGRVGDFNVQPLLLCEGGWVIERGMKVIDPSTTWTGAICGSLSSRGSVMEEYSD